MLDDGAELLIDAGIPNRAVRFMERMQKTAPPDTPVTSEYLGRRRVLVLYGPGGPKKLPLIAKHRRAGGRVAMFDLGYWNRTDAMRLSIDTLHPTPELLAMAPDGPGRREFVLREDAKADGPVMLVGLGPKSVWAYGTGGVQQWERQRLAELRERFPGREVIWRPKGKRPQPLGHLRMVHGMPIEAALRGCSLVVCRHSNVAVDACVAGVPVECEDGAAAALYQGNPAPTVAERMEFLRRLSWWEWPRAECSGAWQWIERVTKQ